MISYTEENIQRILQNLKENIREKKFSSSKFPLFVPESVNLVSK